MAPRSEYMPSMGQMARSGLLAKERHKQAFERGDPMEVAGDSVQLTQQGNVGHLIDVKVIRCTGVLQANGRLTGLYLDDERVPAVEHHAHESRLAAGGQGERLLNSLAGYFQFGATYHPVV